MKRSGYRIIQSVPTPSSIFTGLLSVTSVLQVYCLAGSGSEGLYGFGGLTLQEAARSDTLRITLFGDIDNLRQGAFRNLGEGFGWGSRGAEAATLRQVEAEGTATPKTSKHQRIKNDQRS